MIPLYKIYWDNDDVETISEVIRRGSYWTKGPKIREFEGLISGFVDKQFGVAFNSGTSAFLACLIAYGFSNNDEIIVPSFTFSSSIDSICYIGAKPVFADIEPATYGLDPEDVSEKISEKTRAIIPTNYGGGVCRMPELKEIAEDHDLIIFEDSAEALGAEIIGQGKAGSFGESALFSFTGNKIITTGEGGMIVTNSKMVAEKLELIRSNCDPRMIDKSNADIGLYDRPMNFNWRMSDITAALGISQFNKLEKVVKMRRDNAKYLTRRLANIQGLVPPNPPSNVYNVYQMYTVRVEEDKALRNELYSHLRKNGVDCQIYFPPIHLNTYYRNKFGYEPGMLPMTEELSDQVLTLPMYPSLTVEDMDTMVEKIREFLN